MAQGQAAALDLGRVPRGPGSQLNGPVRTLGLIEIAAYRLLGTATS